MNDCCLFINHGNFSLLPKNFSLDKNFGKYNFEWEKYAFSMSRLSFSEVALDFDKCWIRYTRQISQKKQCLIPTSSQKVLREPCWNPYASWHSQSCWLYGSLSNLFAHEICIYRTPMHILIQQTATESGERINLVKKQTRKSFQESSFSLNIFK